MVEYGVCPAVPRVSRHAVHVGFVHYSRRHAEVVRARAERIQHAAAAAVNGQRHAVHLVRHVVGVHAVVLDKVDTPLRILSVQRVVERLSARMRLTAQHNTTQRNREEHSTV